MRTVTRLVALSLACTAPLAAQAFDPGAPLHTYATTFDRAHDAIELADGSVAVADSRAPAVYLLDSALSGGRAVTSEGSGPGEIQSISGMAAGAPNSFLILDGQLRRWTACRVAEKVTCATVTPPAGYYAYGLLGGDERGGYFFLRALMTAAGPSNDSALVDRWDPAGGVTPAATIANGPQVAVVHTNGSSRYTFNYAWPFVSGPQAAPLPDGSLAVVSSAPYRVTLISPNGTRHDGAPIARTPEPVTPRELDSALVRLDSIGADTKPIRAALRSKGVTMPGTLRTDPRGRIWIGVYHPEAEGKVVYDVLGRDGKRFGSYLLPAGARIVGVGRRAVYAVIADADGLETLSAYRVPGW